MYSRSFYPEGEEKQMLPENYDGTAFQNPLTESGDEAECSVSPKADGSVTETGALKGSSFPILSGLFGGLPNIKIPSIGTEEIIILTVAALLFFNKDGDKECAILLLALLFIS